ncbi:MAG: glycosyltransferase family 2 protein [Clostridiales bacterium]|nr:glycosyltransferase family 2 protein [Clostridiales bacterium]
MRKHTFAVCAYGDSPYLEACVRSLKRQSLPTKIILCTSTPSRYIRAVAEVYSLPLFVREGPSNIRDDWNFAYEKAGDGLVTIAHQDDCYHRDYARTVQECWKNYPDTTVFSTDCVIIKGNTIQKQGLIHLVKSLLRLPLRLRRLADRTFVKRAALCLGNPVICPSCTYDKDALGMPLFDSPYSFALDWDTMWQLATRPGRFICEERPLLRYRIHDGATTKACIENRSRAADETAMYGKIWPKPVVRLLMFFYKGAYAAYGGEKKKSGA